MDIDNILIDGLEYVNWNRDLFEKAHAGGLTAIHATLVYWEDTKESFQKILLGMTLLAGFELAGERILVAYESKAQEDEHSCFSDTTHNDSIYDIVGIKNVWTGKYTRADGSIIEGPGIRNFALSIDTDLTEKIDNSLKLALKTSMEIPRPFDQAILADKGSDTSNSIISLVEELENTADSFVIMAERAGVEISREPEE